MLRLISKDSHRLSQDVLSQGLETKLATLKSSPQHSFLYDFQEFSPNLYVFRAKDLYHELACEMTLERQESFAYSDEASEEEDYLIPIMSCNFPSINVQRFNEKVCWDQYLQGILMFQFQLKILEQLFLFCEDKDAVNLILTFNDADLDYLEVYRRFFISEEQVMTARGEQTEIVIPTDVETYDELVDFMDKVDRDFRRTLWRDQKVNSAFREYLKRYSLSVL